MPMSGILVGRTTISALCSGLGLHFLKGPLLFIAQIKLLPPNSSNLSPCDLSPGGHSDLNAVSKRYNNA